MDWKLSGQTGGSSSRNFKAFGEWHPLLTREMRTLDHGVSFSHQPGRKTGGQAPLFLNKTTDAGTPIVG
jgi:hypothetical protein